VLLGRATNKEHSAVEVSYNENRLKSEKFKKETL
jgi:hypothetical protein